MKLALNLLNQIIEHEQEQDVERSKEWIARGQGEKAVGESWTIFHLKILKKVLEDEETQK